MYGTVSRRMIVGNELKKPDQKCKVSAERNMNGKTAAELKRRKKSPELIMIEGHDRTMLSDEFDRGLKGYDEVSEEAERCLTTQTRRTEIDRVDFSAFRQLRSRQAKL